MKIEITPFDLAQLFNEKAGDLSERGLYEGADFLRKIANALTA